MKGENREEMPQPLSPHSLISCWCCPWAQPMGNQRSKEPGYGGWGTVKAGQGRRRWARASTVRVSADKFLCGHDKKPKDFYA